MHRHFTFALINHVLLAVHMGIVKFQQKVEYERYQFFYDSFYRYIGEPPS